VSGAVVGRKFVIYLGFDEKADADKAHIPTQIIKSFCMLARTE
jgi:hypothetical protein